MTKTVPCIRDLEASGFVPSSSLSGRGEENGDELVISMMMEMN